LLTPDGKEDFVDWKIFGGRLSKCWSRPHWTSWSSNSGSERSTNDTWDHGRPDRACGSGGTCRSWSWCSLWRRCYV